MYWYAQCPLHHVQSALTKQDFDMSAMEALRASRLHNQIQPNVTYLERESSAQGITVDGHSEELAQALRAKGHTIEWVTCEFGIGHRAYGSTS
jgi:gamma-glutamyltranspeptidase/glutathione hydrolase